MSRTPVWNDNPLNERDRQFKESNFERKELTGQYGTGIDQGLHEWLHMRRELANAKQEGAVDIIIKRSAHRYKDVWRELIYLDSPRIDGLEESFPFYNSLDCRALGEQNYGQSFSFDDIRNILKLRHERGLLHVLSTGYDINKDVDSRGRTMLHITCFNGDFNKILILLDHKANVNSVDRKQRTPLMCALLQPKLQNYTKIIRLLFDRRADVNIQDNRGFSPMHLACLNGHKELIVMLLQKKALVNVKDRKGKFAIEYSKEQQQVKSIYTRNMQYAGKKEHQRMWACITSQQFVHSLFSVLEQSCPVCKKKLLVCRDIRLSNYRYWLLLHRHIRLSNYRYWLLLHRHLVV